MNHLHPSLRKCVALMSLCIGTGIAVSQDPTSGSGTLGPNGVPDQFAAQTPVMTFLDMYTQQPWGRYVVTETVTVPKYEYKEVKSTVFVPSWATEPRTTTVTQYEPLYSYQPRVRTINSLNPFAPPQQVMEYVPLVQYQPRNVQQTQMMTYQKYEPREITTMIPVLVNASEQRARFVDRPLNVQPNGGAVAGYPYGQPPTVAQANPNMSVFPTYPIDLNYGGMNYAATRYPMNAPYRNNTVIAAPNVTPSTGFPPNIPTTPSQYPVVYNGPGYAPNGYANAGVPTMAAYPNAYPGAYQAALPTNQRPLFDFSRIASSTGSLFRGGIFNSNRSATAYPSAYPSNAPIVAAMPNSGAMPSSGGYAPAGTPYVAWNTQGGASTSQPNYWSPAQSSGLNFRPTSGPYAAPYTPSMSPVGTNVYRDPNQSGMPATVLR